MCSDTLHRFKDLLELCFVLHRCKMHRRRFHPAISPHFTSSAPNPWSGQLEAASQSRNCPLSMALSCGPDSENRAADGQREGLVNHFKGSNTVFGNAWEICMTSTAGLIPWCVDCGCSSEEATCAVCAVCSSSVYARLRYGRAKVLALAKVNCHITVVSFRKTVLH